MVRYWPTTAADLKMPWREPYRLTGSEPISRRGHVSQSPESSIEDGMHSFQFCRAGSRAARTSLLFRRLVDHLPELSINVRRLIADDFRGPTSPKKNSVSLQTTTSQTINPNLNFEVFLPPIQRRFPSDSPPWLISQPGFLPFSLLVFMVKVPLDATSAGPICVLWCPPQPR